MKCYIFCSAPIRSYEYMKKYDFNDGFVICADGGYVHAKNLNIIPDLWLGDGDSLGGCHILAKEKLVFPIKKDYTDTDLAITEALKRGYREIIIFGALGGRVDHEFSHFCLLNKILQNGGKGTIIDEKNEITMENKSFSVYPSDKKYISFFPYGGNVENFSVRGLCYEAENITLSCDRVQASSNCFLNDGHGEISFSKGCVLVVRSND